VLKSIEDINTTKKRLTIEIPSDVLESEIGNSLSNLRQRVRLPGFRPGKAPINLIEKRFGKEIESEVLEKVIPQYYNNALKEADIQPVSFPELDEEVDYKRKNSLLLSFTVEVLPKIENLTYENVAIKDLPVTVEDSDIEDAINRLRDRKAVFEIADKPIEMDDLVTFDYVDSEIVGEDNPALKELISQMGNEIFPPDIMERALGKSKGDIIEFTTTFEDTLHKKELVGKTATIKLTIKEVKDKTLPEVDDDLAKDLGVDTLSALKEQLQEKIQMAKEAHVKRIQKAEILNKLIESHPFDVPESMVKRQIETLMIEGNLPDSSTEKGQSQPDVDDAMGAVTTDTASPEKTEGLPEDIKEKYQEKALQIVRASVLIDMIGKQEGIIVTDNEVDERISLLAQNMSATPEAIRNFYMYQEGALDRLKKSIFEDKVLDLLLSKATIEKEESE